MTGINCDHPEECEILRLAMRQVSYVFGSDCTECCFHDAQIGCQNPDTEGYNTPLTGRRDDCPYHDLADYEGVVEDGDGDDEE